MLNRFLPAALASCLITATAFAQSAPTPLEARYDPAIPDLETVYGHDFGEEITPPEEAVAYLRQLAEAAPDRMRVVDYATSWEGRPLVYAVIGNPELMARIGDVQTDLQRLADPRGLNAAQREALIADLPVVVWLAYGVHGDEISSTDAALRTAYHLLAAQNDPVTDTILEDALVIIDPVQNPDGRNRFVNSFTQARGLQPDGYRFSAEHDQPWPGGRHNHYLFDMNRDWFIQSQPETRGRTASMLSWSPMVIVDAHEMGGDLSYFFPPVAPPVNPALGEGQVEAQDIVGQNHARWFDRLGYDYFTREIFDAFYPGYGDMWPMLQGGVAFTYEQGSARGLVWTRRDGTDLSYADGVEHHFIASLSTAEVAAANRERFVRGYYEARAEAAANTNDGPAAIVLSRASNRWGAETLARLIARNGIEISRLQAGTTLCGTALTEGGFLIQLNQPAGQLARTLLERDTPIPADFLEGQEDRRVRGLDHEMYDVTAWSLPVMFNVEATECNSRPGLTGDAVSADDPIEAATGSGAFGYVIPWTDAGQAQLVARLAAEGVAMRTSSAAFTIDGQTWPAGSVVIARSEAPANIDSLMRLHARTIGAVYAGLETSWTEEGPNFGSSQFAGIVAPRIAMAWGEGTDANSVGGLRYVLERRYGLPVTVIRASRLGFADLSGFDVLILPEQSGSGYSRTIGESGAENLSRFSRSGGTLIALGDATRFIADPDINLLPIRRELAADTPSGGGNGDGSTVAGSVIADESDLRAALEPRNARPDSSPGALLNIVGNSDSFLSAGYPDGVAAMVTGSDIYTAIPLDEADTVFRFAGADDLVASGHLWAENVEQMAFKPFLVSRRTGSGFVIAFTQDPTARAYQLGLDLALLNAVILAPARSQRLR
ncbi:M14 family zinc carboxypeptidase [Hyphobacterium sp. HN65]|uniref:M14 family zinc carboxypeptidase n=1 Tax=Hyphobacterium lacteum TaxID=3116575 RepID=A0ABU7LRH3_9PROT|nr:M14 family zinc carboxypeptidase [Hyphobacterium sp. HN65]MEE2526518.1 M14 family zinc carboxypeptidase [Hyphobacterium sp. HN65]